MKNKKLVVCTAAFLALSAVVAFVGVRFAAKKPLVDGEWTGSAAGRNGDVVMSVTVSGGKVTAVKTLQEEETDFAKEAIDQIAQALLAGKSVDSIDAVSGATVTSNATKQALKNALNSSRGIAAKSSAKALKDEKADVVVIGAGGAGLCAATEAASLGKKVVVLEKLGNAGGNTLSATGGLNASETSIQKKLGIEDSNAQYIEDTIKGGHNLNDPDLVRNMVEHSAQTVDWLISLGADLTDVGKMAGSTNKRTHRPQGGAPVGAHLVPVLEKAAQTAGAEIRYNNKVTQILKDKDGSVAGVKVSSSEGEYTISARAVIVATGGFGANPELVVKYRPDLAGFGTTNHKGATGDAIALVEPFDADFVQMDQIQTHPTVVPSNGFMITEAVRGNGAIMVNREGKRFGNEMATRDVMSAAILAQTGKTAYLLFDQGVRESLKAIEGYAKKGLLTEGASLEELAQKLGMPAADLKASVDTYNSYQASGKDPDFNRKGDDMPRAIATAPFYAVEVGPAIHHTMGGIKINTKAQVINKSGSVVKGLFAAGEVTGGIHGGNRLGGNAVADICVYGKIAADSALEFLGSK